MTGRLLCVLIVGSLGVISAFQIIEARNRTCSRQEILQDIRCLAKPVGATHGIGPVVIVKCHPTGELNLPEAKAIREKSIAWPDNGQTMVRTRNHSKWCLRWDEITASASVDPRWLIDMRKRMQEMN